jgi:hypothetical protein
MEPMEAATSLISGLLLQKVYVYYANVKLLSGNNLNLNDEDGIYSSTASSCAELAADADFTCFKSGTLIELRLLYPKDIKVLEETAK